MHDADNSSDALDKVHWRQRHLLAASSRPTRPSPKAPRALPWRVVRARSTSVPAWLKEQAALSARQVASVWARRRVIAALRAALAAAGTVVRSAMVVSAGGDGGTRGIRIEVWRQAHTDQRNILLRFNAVLACSPIENQSAPRCSSFSSFEGLRDRSRRPSKVC